MFNRFICLFLVAITVAAGEFPAGDPLLTRRVETVLAPFHVAKRPPAANDWMAKYHEEGQTVAEYMAARTKPGGAARRTIYLQALGAVDGDQAALLDATQAALAAYYAPLVVRRLADLPLQDLPASAKRTGMEGEQILSTWLLVLLRTKRPADALAVLGLTTSDLWPGPGWNYVFGQASLSEHVGVWSSYRFGPPRDPRRLERTIKTAIHETGHQFGMPHCIRWECLMNGANHRDETDAGPLWFCHECEAKVAWACGGDPAVRLRRLAAFATSHGLAPAATFWNREAETLDAATGR